MGMNDVPRCQHVKVNGTQCGSPALRRKRFCYFHDNYRQTKARLADESQALLCNLPLLEDANSIQLAVMQVIHLMNSGRMDTKVAGLTLYALQTAASNLKRVNFEVEKVTDVVIDQDTLDLTCINGPQWSDRDFQDSAETIPAEKISAEGINVETINPEKINPEKINPEKTSAEGINPEKTSPEGINAEKTEASPDQKPEDLPAAVRVRLRKKPDPLPNTEDLNNSIAGRLLLRMGPLPVETGNARRDDPPPQPEPQMIAAD